MLQIRLNRNVQGSALMGLVMTITRVARGFERPSMQIDAPKMLVNVVSELVKS